MGKIVKTVLPMAVSIAVPFALPAIAPALAASPIFSGVVSGALGSLITGGNPLLGAVTGGIGGGLSQAFSSFGPGVFNPASPGATSALGGSPSFITGPEFFSTGTGIPGGPGFSAAASLSGPTAPISFDFSSELPFDAALDSQSGFLDFPSAPGISTTSSTAGLSASPTISPANFAGDTGLGATAAGASGDGGLLSGNFGKNLGNMGLKLLSSALTEEPDLSAAEDALARQRALAESEFGANQEQLDRRNRAANEVMGEARSVDVEGAGRRAGESRLAAAERLTREVDDPSRRGQAITRGIRTRGIASVPQAVASAQEAARRQQLAGLTSGAGLIPTAFSGGRGFSSLASSAAELERLRSDLEKRNAEGVGSFFSDFFA
jgi:hypothetical protein